MEHEAIKNLLYIAIKVSLEAGEEIMEVYDSGNPETQLKEDRSPLTLADLSSNRVITSKLKETGYPILSEEDTGIPFENRKAWTCFWMIDPLDGTKEFIKRNGEFTVNIALIENNKPILGVVYLPVLNQLYYACKDHGAYRIDRLDQYGIKSDPEKLIQHSSRLPDQAQSKTTRVVASRSHLSPETEEFIESLESNDGKVEMLPAGSSLKLCLIAEGKAEVYPRLGPTMEWDIAAGHIVITESGGTLMKLDGTTLDYNKPELLNPWFVARSKHYLEKSKSA